MYCLGEQDDDSRKDERQNRTDCQSPRDRHVL